MFWRPDQAPAVIAILAPCPVGVGSSVTLGSLRPTVVREAEEGLYQRLTDGGQLLVVGQPAPDQPLALLLPFDAYRRTRWLTASTSLARGTALDPFTPTQRRRHRLALQAWDGRQAGASEREIAEVIFEGQDLPRGATWKSDSLRAQTIRLIDAASRRVRGAYRALLRMQPPTGRCR